MRGVALFQERMINTLLRFRAPCGGVAGVVIHCSHALLLVPAYFVYCVLTEGSWIDMPEMHLAACIIG